jgi:hypothetical protein
MHNYGGEICWKEATCKIEELKNNIEIDLRKISCEWPRAMILILAALNVWVLVPEYMMFSTKI